MIDVVVKEARKEKIVNGQKRGVYSENRHCKEWIAQHKVKSFKALFEFIRKDVGTYEGARVFIGLSDGTLDGLEKNRISHDTARKILDAYNKVKAKV